MCSRYLLVTSQIKRWLRNGFQSAGAQVRTEPSVAAGGMRQGAQKSLSGSLTLWSILDISGGWPWLSRWGGGFWCPSFSPLPRNESCWGKPASTSIGPHCLAPVQVAAHTGVPCHPDVGGRWRPGFCGRRGQLWVWSGGRV